LTDRFRSSNPTEAIPARGRAEPLDQLISTAWSGRRTRGASKRTLNFAASGQFLSLIDGSFAVLRQAGQGRPVGSRAM